MSEATKAPAEASAAARRDFFMLSSPKFFGYLTCQISQGGERVCSAGNTLSMI
jgi:hypothetical protein